MKPRFVGRAVLILFVALTLNLYVGAKATASFNFLPMHVSSQDTSAIAVSHTGGAKVVLTDTGRILYAAPAMAGTDDCLSWANACPLPIALNQAQAGDEVWVQAGVYYPGANRTDSFVLNDGVAVYGGFAGTETSRAQRDWRVNVTVLSGDIDRNDVNTDGNGIAETWQDIQGANAYHVVVASGVGPTAVLDGFVVTGGQANGSDSGQERGGGVYVGNGNPVLRNVVVVGNRATLYGGGVLGVGGGLTLSGARVQGNESGVHGGGVALFGANGTVEQSVIAGNRSAFYGSGLFVQGGQVTVRNTLVSGNQASRGGTIHGEGGAQMAVESATVAGNANGGIGMSNATATVVNSIVWGNSEWTLSGQVTVQHSVVQGGWSNGSAVLDVDPLFVAPVAATAAPAAAGNYRLRYGSPAIDYGTASGVTLPATDLDGQPRVTNAAVDAGAYEYPAGRCGPNGVLYVRADAQGANDGSSWVNAYTDLQAALAVAWQCEVWVARGVYYPAANGSDRTAAFMLRSDVQIYGGFAGTETSRAQRDWRVNVTVLSGDIDRNDVNTDGNGIAETWQDIQGANAYHVVVASGVGSTAVLDGFVVTAGQADGSVSGQDRGGGVYVMKGSPVLRNVVVVGNRATLYGGGVLGVGGGLTLSGARVQGNESGVHGGGVALFGANGTVEQSVIAGNRSAFYGSGLFVQGGQVTVRNTLVSGNQASRGGTIHGEGGAQMAVESATVAGNANGGIGMSNATATVVNSIVWGNSEWTLSGQVTVQHSVVQGGWSNGSGVLDVDPLFVAPVAATAAPAATGNYRLRYGSPAIDYGTASGVTLPATDADGQPRVANAAVDAGAYEFQAYTLTVNRIGEGSVQRVPDQDAYTYLDQVRLTAEPAEGWVFTGWSGDVVTTTNPLTITLSRTTVITATFSRLNRAPAFTSTPVTTAAQGAVYTYTVRISDPDTGDVLAITAPAKPAWLTLTDHGNGTATLTGTPAMPGAYEVVLRVTDRSGLSAEQRFTITVTRTRWEVFVPLITK